jgi:hypothetical protein
VYLEDLGTYAVTFKFLKQKQTKYTSGYWKVEFKIVLPNPKIKTIDV